MNENRETAADALWALADRQRDRMNTDVIRTHMLSCLCLRALSDNYERVAQKELGAEWPGADGARAASPLTVWMERHGADARAFQAHMWSKLHYSIDPGRLWGDIAPLAHRRQDGVSQALAASFRSIENGPNALSALDGLFSGADPHDARLGRTDGERNRTLGAFITGIDTALADMEGTPGDLWENLVDRFAAVSVHRDGEIYTPKPVSDILSAIVAIDQGAERTEGRALSVMDFTCGSGSLMANVRKGLSQQGDTARFYGQDRNYSMAQLARMTMLVHGARAAEFDVHYGDSLKNDGGLLQDGSLPGERVCFDAVVANPPFSLRWFPTWEQVNLDQRFREHGLRSSSGAPADFGFLLHGLHHLKDDGVMTVVLPNGPLFRDGERSVRQKLVEDGHIDSVIGLPPAMFHSSGIPVCILVLKKNRTDRDILFIDASGEYEKKNRLRNGLSEAHVEKIVDTWCGRPEHADRYARRVGVDEVRANDFNLNIARYMVAPEPEAKPAADDWTPPEPSPFDSQG